ncbi:hypothetical protein MLD38_018171 [Melastoma candidum]|uniref:Uncharacterized protein n=1 Tax=Melastoma candidum TaxID=119954 RepID=A0ACB9QUW7_9MYRT|nr:hypothetical protein MLD38_018171 [Melastoma candidum]
MKKKAVPEWLNSSIWSTSPAMNSTTTTTTSASASADLVHRYSPSSNPYIYDDDDVDPPAPPPPPPPPDTVRRDVRDRDPGRLGDYDRDDEGPSAEEISRQALLLTEVSKKMINIGELRRLACQGVPDNAGVRPMVWKLLLGYLPPDRSLWPSELAKKRSHYKNLKTDLLVNPLVRNHPEIGGFFIF